MVVRSYYAASCYLNPDEAAHFMEANQESIGDALRASRLSTHPPLLILVLYGVLAFGSSEFVLRLPSVILGSAALWLVFRWLQRTLGHHEALAGTVLLAFSPAMISASTEVRQYGLLLFSMCGCLYCLERSLAGSSVRWVVLHSLLLYGAILSHYTAIWITATCAIYALLRFWREHPSRQLYTTWLTFQAGAGMLYGWLYITHIAELRARVAGAANSWVKRLYFQPDEESLGGFIADNTLGVFEYFFQVPFVGAAALLLFSVGLVLLLLDATPKRRASPRLFAALLLLPLAIGCAGAVAQLLPFGGGPQSVYLLPFAAAGLSPAIVRFVVFRRVSLTLSLALVVVPVWLLTTGPANNPRRLPPRQIKAALAYLEEAVPADALLLVDDQTRHVLAYYLAPNRKAPIAELESWVSVQPIGKYRVVASLHLWNFSARGFWRQFGLLAGRVTVKPDDQLWVMTVGWDGGSRFQHFASRLPATRVSQRRSFGLITVMRVHAPPRLGLSEGRPSSPHGSRGTKSIWAGVGRDDRAGSQSRFRKGVQGLRPGVGA
jgi:hypothetical protein